MDLVELDRRSRDRDLRELGTAVNLAVGEPKQLARVFGGRGSAVSNQSVPPQLRIPRRRAQHG